MSTEAYPSDTIHHDGLELPLYPPIDQIKPPRPLDEPRLASEAYDNQDSFLRYVRIDPSLRMSLSRVLDVAAQVFIDVAEVTDSRVVLYEFGLAALPRHIPLIRNIGYRHQSLPNGLSLAARVTSLKMPDL